MRSQKTTKIPLKFNDFILDCGDIRDDGECDTMGDTKERMEGVDSKECDDVDGGNDSTDDWVNIKKADKKSFADAIAMNLVDNDRKLECIPTEFDKNGVEVVVFNEIMVEEGIKRWDLTLCGFFVGHKMSVNEL
ncbi:hypothetical protein Tco_1358931, partial [Tanacetum coccineum]